MGKSVARVTKPIPRLRDGDRMTSREFFRRYEADPEAVRAELLDGVVYVNARRLTVDGKEAIVPPISNEGHGEPQYGLTGWLAAYSAHTPGTVGSAPSTIRISGRNAPEPDVLLRILPECGGRSSVGEDEFLHGPPELIVEVSNTSVGRDLGLKFRQYEREGVKEYIVWRTAQEQIDWFALKRKKYVPLAPDPTGIVRSETFPGLWLDVPALLAGNMAKVLQVVQQGLASPEHAAFVEKLRAAAAKRKKT